MKSHTLAKKLLELPDQFVYIHPNDTEQAYPCNHITVLLNSIVLTSVPEKGGEK